MIFDSLGIGELGVVFVVAVLFVDPKKFGKLARGWGQFKRKWMKIQAEMKSQLDALAAEDEAVEKQKAMEGDKTSMRLWGRDQARTLTATARMEAARAVLQTVTAWPTYQNAKVVSCFAGALDEVDTDELLRKILADGKTLLMPYVEAKEHANAPENSLSNAEESTAQNIQGNVTKERVMGMAVVVNVDKDLREGEFHILEPLPELRHAENVPSPDLVIVPGTCFDLRGGRLGKGKGFYDVYLAGVQTVKLGLCFDVQIARKNLALDARDQYMDALASEKRFQVFSGAQSSE